MIHPALADLEGALDHIRGAPSDAGRLELIVCRPEPRARTVLDEAELSLADGLVGDCWRTRGSRRTDDGSAHPEKQLTVMAARAIAAVCPDRARWPLAGDQLYIDLDLSEQNLPPGTRLEIGSAVIEVTVQPHRGCALFGERFGADAARFVNSPVGRALNLRGVNAKVVIPGLIRTGDTVTKVSDPPSRAAD